MTTSVELLTNALRAEAKRLGFDLAGACPAVATPGFEGLRQWLNAGYAGQMTYLADRVEAYQHPASVLEGVRSILMLAMNYRTCEPNESGAGQGRVSRYAWGGDYHRLIRQRLRQLADEHRRLAPHARVRGVVDTAPIMERQFAQLAGLGWIGKNTLLLNRQLGSWFFLAALLTTEELSYDPPFAANHCGTCRACIDACPTGALVEPYRLDARRCISYLTIELRQSIPRPQRAGQGNWLFGCDICQDVCPWNRRTPACREAKFEPRSGMNPIPAADLLGLDEPRFAERFHDTPLARPRRAGILRNAAIVMGNDPADSNTEALLAGLTDEDPVVRQSCVWALGQQGTPAARDALRARLAIETTPEVREEILLSLESDG